jgi:hypothetical protein
MASFFQKDNFERRATPKTTSCVASSIVGRTPGSAADALVGFLSRCFLKTTKRVQGDARRPRGLPYVKAAAAGQDRPSAAAERPDPY